MLHVRQNKKSCYGCSACVEHCPTQAISMCPDDEGFLYAVINRSLCIDCEKCLQVCETHNKLIQKNTRTPECYFGWNKNSEIRLQSSSGGFFSIFAEQVILNGGVVFGVAFTKPSEVCHIQVDNQSGLSKLRGSKYLQSNINNMYPAVKDVLESGKQVLFSGTPCQISGLYAFLGKDYANLLTIDLACAGVSSPMVFQKYLNHLAPDCMDGVEVKFRDKAWGDPGITLSVYENKKLIASEKGQESRYTKGFLEGLFNRPSCSRCPFATTSRIGDITLADFWGATQYRPLLERNKGISLLFVNNKKGQFWLTKAKPYMEHCESVPIKYAKVGNIFSGPRGQHPGRQYFLNHFETTENFNSLVETALTKTDKHVGILNFCYGNGYGQVLMNYALHHVLELLGYSSEVINYNPRGVETKDLAYEQFREKFLLRTPQRVSARGLEPFNNRFGIFLVGSDQVWRWHNNFTYMLYWVYGPKVLMAYAASFGFDYFQGNLSETNVAADLLSRFDAISVREASGVEICNQLGCEATHVLDPTLLLDEEDYQCIIDSEKNTLPNQPYIAYYFLDKERKKEFEQSDTANLLVKKYQLVDLGINDDTSPLSVPNWLFLMQHAEHVLTDSYHCVLFSIIFKRSFICLERYVGGNERILSLYEQLAIPEDRFQSTCSFNPDSILTTQLNYGAITESIVQLRQPALSFLTQTLSRTPKEKTKLQYPYFDEYNQPAAIDSFLAEFHLLQTANAKLSQENSELRALVGILQTKMKILRS